MGTCALCLKVTTKHKIYCFGVYKVYREAGETLG